MKASKKCPNCGAPITTEICPYCQNATGLDTAHANMEYPVIPCKEANVNFWNFWFPMIFALGFGVFGAGIPLVLYFTLKESTIVPIFLFAVFFTIGVIAFVIAIRHVIRYQKVKRNGKEIEATVYGYMDDNILLNNQPAQIVKLLVSTDDGPKFILYQLGDIKHPYKINSKIKLLVYKDIFIVKEEKKYHFE